MNKAYVLIRNIVNTRKHTRYIRKTVEIHGNKQQTGGMEKGKHRDFSNPAADCRKMADTQSHADSGMPADIPSD